MKVWAVMVGKQDPWLLRLFSTKRQAVTFLFHWLKRAQEDFNEFLDHDHREWVRELLEDEERTSYFTGTTGRDLVWIQQIEVEGA